MKSLFRKIVPMNIREWRGKITEKKLRKDIIIYFEHLPDGIITEEQQKVLDYLRVYPYSFFPYSSFPRKYINKDISVFHDENKNLRYVIHENKKLYFKREWNEKKIKNYYRGLLIEQDIESPHRYETSQFMISEGNIVIDAGVAEGNFALSIIEKVEKIYLFETDKDWIEVLKATFEPYKDKVVIINKFVSDNNNQNNCTLDELFENKHIDFIKADIEGAEILLVKGAQKLLTSQSPKVVLCTYHRQNDAELLEKMLADLGYRTEFSQGYMIYSIYDKPTIPYLRKGLIRGQKL